MAESFRLVPGYVVRPERYGPDVFENVSGLSWTDQQGLTQGWGTTFRGRRGVQNWFHFPITNPTIERDVRLQCNLAAVTLNLEPRRTFLRSMHLWDRTNRFFISPDLNVTDDLSATWATGRNVFEFPDHVVDGAIGISVLIEFSETSEVTFTGAGLRFHD